MKVLVGLSLGVVLCNAAPAAAQEAAPSACSSGTAAFVAQSERERSELAAAVAASGHANETLNVVNPVGRRGKLRLRNRHSVAQLLEQNYPPTLRDAGVSGDVTLLVKIGESGNVAYLSVFRSAPDEAFNAAALAVVRQMLFDPAQHDGCTVPAWTLIPVSFRARP